MTIPVVEDTVAYREWLAAREAGEIALAEGRIRDAQDARAIEQEWSSGVWR